MALNRFLRTVSPITATFAAMATSFWVNELPSAIGQSYEFRNIAARYH